MNRIERSREAAANPVNTPAVQIRIGKNTPRFHLASRGTFPFAEKSGTLIAQCNPPGLN